MITNEVKTILQNLCNFSLFSAENIKNLPSQITDTFDEIEVDIYGNLHFVKKGKGEKIQILFRCEPTGVLLGERKNDKVYVQLLGKKKPEEIKHTIVYQKQKEVGALRLDEKTKPYLEVFCNFKEEIDDICEIENDIICKDNLLYGTSLNTTYPLILLYFISNEIKNSEKYFDFTLWNDSLTKESGGIATCKACGANQIVVFSNIKSCDKYPISKGPKLVLKDGSYIASKDARSFIKNNSSFQPFIGKTDKFLEQLSIHCHNASLFSIYLPVKQEKGCAEIMDCNDIQKAGELLLKTFLLL